MDGLPDVASVGETHWIVDRDHGCRECRDEPCPVFASDLLVSLRGLSEADRKGQWWPLIAEAAGSRVVVSSDKRPLHFEKLGLPSSWIFLYKDPVAHVYSKARRLARGNEQERITDADVTKALAWLVKNTHERLDFLESQGAPTAVLRNESLVLRPVATARRLASFLGVPEDPTCVEYWNHDHHYIGGNFSVRNVTRSSTIDHTLRIDETYKTGLTDTQREMISESEPLRAVMERVRSAPDQHGWLVMG